MRNSPSFCLVDFVWSLKFYIKRNEDSLYFGHFLKVVYSRTCEGREVWIKVRKLKENQKWHPSSKYDSIGSVLLFITFILKSFRPA